MSQRTESQKRVVRRSVTPIVKENHPLAGSARMVLPNAAAVQRMLSAIERLDPELVEVFRLHSLEDLNYQEISARLSLPLGVIKSRAARGKIQFGRLLESEGPETDDAIKQTSQSGAANVDVLAVDDAADAEVIHRSIEVIGDRSKAMRWLGTPVRALNYATPISLMHDADGRDAVLSVLGRLEHGVL